VSKILLFQQTLIKQGSSDITTIETRKDVLTLTNGATVLELSMPCPPVCASTDEQYSIRK
jgi:hypothetical protein